MKPAIQEGEEILVKCPVTFKLRYPLTMTPKKRDAYLTTGRLIIEGSDDFIYIPFPWILGLKLADFQPNEKLIELDYEKKLRFNVALRDSFNVCNERTEKLYKWLCALCTGSKPSSEVFQEIKATSRDF